MEGRQYKNRGANTADEARKGILLQSKIADKKAGRPLLELKQAKTCAESTLRARNEVLYREEGGSWEGPTGQMKH